MQICYLEAIGCNSQRLCDRVELSESVQSAKKKKKNWKTAQKTKERKRSVWWYIGRWVFIEWKLEDRGTLGENIATAFWAPKATKSQAPHETLFTTLLHPAPINTFFTSIPPFIDMVICKYITTEREREPRREQRGCNLYQIQRAAKPNWESFRLQPTANEEKSEGVCWLGRSAQLMGALPNIIF